MSDRIKYATTVTISLYSDERPTADQLAEVTEWLRDTCEESGGGLYDLGWVDEIHSTEAGITGHRWTSDKARGA